MTEFKITQLTKAQRIYLTDILDVLEVGTYELKKTVCRFDKEAGEAILEGIIGQEAELDFFLDQGGECAGDFDREKMGMALCLEALARKVEAALEADLDHCTKAVTAFETYAELVAACEFYTPTIRGDHKEAVILRKALTKAKIAHHAC